MASSHIQRQYCYGNSTFDDNGNPVYPENGLQLTVDLSQDSGVSPFTATVDVKQGFAGVLQDALDRVLARHHGFSGHRPIKHR